MPASLEPLESRQLLSNSAAPWQIEGAPTNDHIVIRASADHPGRIEAVVNGVVVGSRSRRSLHKVVIKSGQGDDQIDVQLGFADRHLVFRIYGGQGDDQIKGGVERDLLFGGTGDDTLNGGGGRDKIRGQQGSDRLGGGKDHLRDVIFRDTLDTLVGRHGDLVRNWDIAQPPVPVAAPASSLEEGIDRFAFDLYSVLAKKYAGQNLFFSPYSIATALGMLAAGSDTAAATVSGLLHRSDPELSSSFAQFLDRWQQNSNAAYELNIANAAWFSKKLPLPQEWSDILHSSFHSKIDSLNFAQNAEAAGIINAWISEQTHGRIPKLIDASSLGPDTSFVLTNAIYFKGQWVNGFDQQFTRSRPFTLAGGKTENVAMMYQNGSFNYFGNDQLQLLEMPYKGDDLEMVVLLPRTKDGLQQLGASLSAQTLNGWINQARTQDVNVYLPRFSMDNHFSLLEQLKQLGLQEQISDTDSISDIIHQANIDVDEEGTVAAAATAIIGITNDCVCTRPTPPTFSADHPFLYAIRDRKTGGLLFLGQETKPPEAPADMPTAPPVGSSNGSSGGLILQPVEIEPTLNSLPPGPIWLSPKIQL